MMQEIRIKRGLALSIQQPWAWLIVNGYKDVENRTWLSHLRGWIGIHAGQKFDKQGESWVKDEFPDITLPAEYPCGLVGRAQLIDCIQESKSPWFFGPYGFLLQNAEPFLAPIPCKGKLGFFKPDCRIPEFWRIIR